MVGSTHFLGATATLLLHEFGACSSFFPILFSFSSFLSILLSFSSSFDFCSCVALKTPLTLWTSSTRGLSSLLTSCAGCTLVNASLAILPGVDFQKSGGLGWLLS